MNRPLRSSAELRLFVAAYPPPEAVVAMLAALEPLGLARHRATPEEQVHLTLSFIGDTRAGDLDDVRESVERSAAGVSGFSLSPRRLITLPPRGRPRLVALETDAPPPLLEIVRRLAIRMARRVRQKPADKFLPHLTLCRFHHSADPPQLTADVALPPFPIDRIVLVQSHLTTAGAVHTPVAAFPLVAATDQHG